MYSTPAGRELGYRIVGPRGDEVAKSMLTLSAFGGGWGSLELSPTMALGEYRVEFTADSRQVGAAMLFRLEEYRLPEFRVSVATPEDENGAPRIFRPGDAIVADQDGAICVPAAAAQTVYDIAHGREQVEEIIKAELIANPGPPGRYYPFKPPIKPESPLGKLLKSKGVPITVADHKV